MVYCYAILKRVICSETEISLSLLCQLHQGKSREERPSIVCIYVCTLIFLLQFILITHPSILIMSHSHSIPIPLSTPSQPQPCPHFRVPNRALDLDLRPNPSLILLQEPHNSPNTPRSQSSLRIANKSRIIPHPHLFSKLTLIRQLKLPINSLICLP